jgi:diguanylate cyclase (GGDEF)-like protein/PAS domain S-box-containing protein
MKRTLAQKETSFDPAVKNSELRYRRLFEAAQDGILILDAGTGAIMDVNPFLMNMLGYSRNEFITKKLWEVGAFRDIDASQEAFQVLQHDEYIRYKDLPLRAKSGELIPVEFVSNVYQEGAKKVIQCNVRDITERVHTQETQLRREALLREQSVRDYLTGLFNRRYLEETLERELLRAARRQLPLSVIMLDVDDFKQFNDTYGHAAGDAILRRLGRLLLDQVRGEDIPSRYGGDEFLIVLPEALREATRIRAECIRENARYVNILFEGRILAMVTLSLGIATFPQDGTTAATLLRIADHAMYRAKREGRNRVGAAE